MDFPLSLISGDSITSNLVIIGLVGAIGLAVGSLKIRGVKFGITGVLFAGLIFGHYGFKLNPDIAAFVREMGLVLFVYSVGTQIGPGFLASLKRQGLQLNLLAAGIVILGSVLTVVIGKVAGLNIAVLVGMLAGGTTNTASLAVAQEALKFLPEYSDEMASMPGLGYAVAYPFGIIGVILAMVFIRNVFKINLENKAEIELPSSDEKKENIERRFIKVENDQLDGITIENIPQIGNSGIVIARVIQDDKVLLATSDTVIRKGQVILAVGDKDKLEKFTPKIGVRIEFDINKLNVKLESRWLLVTRSTPIRQTLRDLRLREHYGVNITRMSRSEVVMSPHPDIKLHFGDRLYAVGPTEMLDKVATLLGNSHQELNHPKLASMFLGIIFGLILGNIPFHLPGVPEPLRLGIAGGPMLIAILFSWLGRFGPVIWYIPKNVNLASRETGIVLFFVSVGLVSGQSFVNTLMTGDGIQWMLLAAIITVVPLLIFGFIARKYVKLNYTMICGLLAGSHTDPPALTYAAEHTGSEAPYIIYATVYPVTTILRILMIQFIVIFYNAI